MASGGSVAARASRPCCGTCRYTGLARTKTGWECRRCGRLPWDGSEVSEDQLPAVLEQLIARGLCTRRQAFEGFLRIADLAQAAVDREITDEQALAIVDLNSLALIGKARPQ